MMASVLRAEKSMPTLRSLWSCRVCRPQPAPLCRAEIHREEFAAWSRMESVHPKYAPTQRCRVRWHCLLQPNPAADLNLTLRTAVKPVRLKKPGNPTLADRPRHPTRSHEIHAPPARPQVSPLRSNKSRPNDGVNSGFPGNRGESYY